MKLENIKNYSENFNQFAYSAGDIEFWLVRDLQILFYK